MMKILISRLHNSLLSSSIIALFLFCNVLLSTKTVVVLATEATLNKEGMDEQWKLWPYFTETIKWHSEWIRYNATSTSITEQFRAYREFDHNQYGSSTIQHNTYLYNDERGTVSECRACGPWILNRTDPISSSPYGIIHPSRPYMSTILFKHRSAAWLMKDIPSKAGISPAGFELFLGDGEYLRLSVGVVYDVMGQLIQVSAIREDSRDFNLFWSSNKKETKKYTNRKEQEIVLNGIFSPLSSSSKEEEAGGASSSRYSVNTVTVPGPIMNDATHQGDNDNDAEEVEHQLNSLKLINPNVLLDNDVVFEMPDGIYLVCPSQLPTKAEDDDTGGSSDFVIAGGWKKHEGSTWTSSVEARYTNFVMKEVIYVTLNSDYGEGDNTSAATSNRMTKTIMHRHHEVVAAIISVVAIIGFFI